MPLIPPITVGEPLTSLEKLARIRAELGRPPGADAEPIELAMRQLVQLFGPMLLAQLPENAGDFDDLLERAADALLQLRSDDAPGLSIAHADHQAVDVDDAAELADDASNAGYVEPGSLTDTRSGIDR